MPRRLTTPVAVNRDVLAAAAGDRGRCPEEQSTWGAFGRRQAAVGSAAAQPRLELVNGLAVVLEWLEAGGEVAAPSPASGSPRPSDEHAADREGAACDETQDDGHDRRR
jgi:hypothetical protein